MCVCVGERLCVGFRGHLPARSGDGGGAAPEGGGGGGQGGGEAGKRQRRRPREAAGVLQAELLDLPGLGEHVGVGCARVGITCV